MEGILYKGSKTNSINNSFELTSGEVGKKNHMNVWGKKVRQRKKQHKCPEAGAYLACSKSSKEVMVAGMK